MRKRIIVFIFSVIVLLLTISLFGIGNVLEVIEGSNPSLVALAMVFQTIIIFLYALRFRIIASKYKKLSFRDAFYVATIGNFISSLTPIVKIGGQPLMVYLTKEKIGSAKSSAFVLMDTIVDLLASVVVVAAVVVIFRNVIPAPLFFPLLLFAIVSIVLVLSFVKLFLSKHILARIVNWLVEKISRIRRVHAIFHPNLFRNSFRLVLEDKKLLTAGVGISFIAKLFEMLRMWIIFQAIGIALSPGAVLIVWSFMLMVLMIPWLPGHLGLFEFGGASAFMLLGIASSQAAGGVLLDRLVSFWYVAFFSLAVIWISENRLGELLELSEKSRKKMK